MSFSHQVITLKETEEVCLLSMSTKLIIAIIRRGDAVQIKGSPQFQSLVTCNV